MLTKEPLAVWVVKYVSDVKQKQKKRICCGHGITLLDNKVSFVKLPRAKMHVTFHKDDIASNIIAAIIM